MIEPIVIGRATLYCGDCREVLPTLGRVDAVVTDPPYGLGSLLGPSEKDKEWGKLHKPGGHSWDQSIPDNIAEVVATGREAIIWGGNYFDLPPRRGWLLWDKVVRQFTSGHAEMAWTTLDQPVRAFNYANCLLAVEGKEHPTQKPVALMRWCLEFIPNARTILDPFMGSGTTGVAAVQMGRDFIGIEREPKYFDIAVKRIEEAQKQADLFIEQPPAPKPVQGGLL